VQVRVPAWAGDSRAGNVELPSKVHKRVTLQMGTGPPVLLRDMVAGRRGKRLAVWLTMAVA
jgi:hypothetical protein